MQRIALLIAFFALLFIVQPSLTARAEKKDPDKAEKKNEAKKDDPKKTDYPEKEKGKDEPKMEKLNYSFAFVTKLISANGESGRELTVETKEVDQKKVADVQTWQAQRMQQLTQQAAQMQQQLNQAFTQKDPKARATALQNAAKAQANYQNAVYKFQVELTKKDIYNTKPYDVRAHDEAKVRSMTLPVEFDDMGFEKKWTKKEIEDRMDKTGLPGLPVEFDQLKSGQYVIIYMAKAPLKDKDKNKDQPKKKAPDDAPPPTEVKSRPEFIMIVILQQPAPPK
jgi:hypothetical protein